MHLYGRRLRVVPWWRHTWPPAPNYAKLEGGWLGYWHRRSECSWCSADSRRMQTWTGRLNQATGGLPRPQKKDGQHRKGSAGKAGSCHITDTLTDQRRRRSMEELRKADSRLSIALRRLATTKRPGWHGWVFHNGVWDVVPIWDNCNKHHESESRWPDRLRLLARCLGSDSASSDTKFLFIWRQLFFLTVVLISSIWKPVFLFVASPRLTCATFNAHIF